MTSTSQVQDISDISTPDAIARAQAIPPETLALSAGLTEPPIEEFTDGDGRTYYLIRGSQAAGCLAALQARLHSPEPEEDDETPPAALLGRLAEQGIIEAAGVERENGAVVWMCDDVDADELDGYICRARPDVSYTDYHRLTPGEHVPTNIATVSRPDAYVQTDGGTVRVEIKTYSRASVQTWQQHLPWVSLAQVALQAGPNSPGAHLVYDWEGGQLLWREYPAEILHEVRHQVFRRLARLSEPQEKCTSYYRWCKCGLAQSIPTDYLDEEAAELAAHYLDIKRQVSELEVRAESYRELLKQRMQGVPPGSYQDRAGSVQVRIFERSNRRVTDWNAVPEHAQKTSTSIVYDIRSLIR